MKGHVPKVHPSGEILPFSPQEQGLPLSVGCPSPSLCRSATAPPEKQDKELQENCHKQQQKSTCFSSSWFPVGGTLGLILFNPL